MRFSLTYQAEYRYSEPVYDQHNVLRVKPATTSLQRVRNFRLTLEPAARTRSHTDYFGTEAIQWGVPAEHDRLPVGDRHGRRIPALTHRRRAAGWSPSWR
jgi:hypothetical protein